MKTTFISASRIVFGIIFLFLGLSHFYYPAELAVYVPLPTGSIYFVYLVGTTLTFSSIAVLMNRWITAALVTIALTLAISGAFVQIGVEWRNQDEIMQQVGIANILKIFSAVLILTVLLLTRSNKS